MEHWENLDCLRMHSALRREAPFQPCGRVIQARWSCSGSGRQSAQVMKRLIVNRSRVVEGSTGTRTIYTLRLTHTGRPRHISLGRLQLLPLGLTNHLPECITRRHIPFCTASQSHHFCHLLFALPRSLSSRRKGYRPSQLAILLQSKKHGAARS